MQDIYITVDMSDTMICTMMLSKLVSQVYGNKVRHSFTLLTVDSSSDMHSLCSFPFTITHILASLSKTLSHPGPLRGREGVEQEILPRGPRTFKGPHEALIFTIFSYIGCIFMLFLFLLLSRHCLDSMSERLCRIISNAFTVSVDKLIDTCKHVESTPLIN